VIRAATPDDIPRLVAWGREFHAAAALPCAYDEGATAGFLAQLIDAGQPVLMHERGFIGGVLTPVYCDPAWLVAIEMFWWAERDGRQLLAAFEAEAKARGAREIRMTSLSALPRADGLLRRLGYAATEISYSRVI